MAVLDDLKANLVATLDIVGTSTKDFAPTLNSPYMQKQLALTVGTTADKANQVWGDQRTLTASATETLNLNDGSLTNQWLQTVAFSVIKFIWIYNNSMTGDLLIGGAASNVFVAWLGDSTDKVRVRRGGLLVLGALDATGYAMGSTTANLKLANEDSAASLIYDIMVVGVAA